MTNRTKEILEKLDELIPNPRCELEYNKPYELLIATVLSAQCSDARVNQVTKVLWHKYTLKTLSKASLKEIENIIYPVGTYHNKAYYIKEIATRLLEDYKGVVPNDFNYLLTLPGVGRKTANVVLSNITPSKSKPIFLICISNILSIINITFNFFEFFINYFSCFFNTRSLSTNSKCSTIFQIIFTIFIFHITTVK